jgi:hypothetical protein
MKWKQNRNAIESCSRPALKSPAIAQVVSCEACNPDADWPFESILDSVMLFSGVHTDYFMPELPSCPRCKSTVTEKTLVEWV